VFTFAAFICWERLGAFTVMEVSDVEGVGRVTVVVPPAPTKFTAVAPVNPEPLMVTASPPTTGPWVVVSDSTIGVPGSGKLMKMAPPSEATPVRLETPDWDLLTVLAA
jgi:hypothetical protein